MSTDLYRRPRHPIRVVMERTGLPLETLRAWERRYGAVRPQRTEGAQRRYTDADVERLRMLARVVAGGRSIGQVARLSTEELAALAREDEEARAPGRGRRAEAKRWEHYLESAMAAVAELDAGRLETVLRKAALLAGAAGFAEGVAVPLLRRLGSGWAEGTLSVAHEHLASAVLRRTLGTLLAETEAPEGAPVLVCATPAGQAHEFGVLIAAVMASTAGWRVVYLGADLPAPDIAEAVKSTGARAVALSVIFPSDDPALPAELRRLRSAIAPEVRVLVGGAGIEHLSGVLNEIAIEPVSRLADLVPVLSGSAPQASGTGGS
jgi:MerR family transcriptional regulator, light-induced transcriptional regulator